MSLRLAFARTDCTPMTHCVPIGRNSWPVRVFLCDIVLTLVDFVIEALFLQQIAVPALLHNTAVAQNQNEVGIDDRGQAVGDDEAGPAAHEAVHGFLDEQFRTRIDIGCRFIENQQFALREKRPRDGQQLLLARGDR